MHNKSTLTTSIAIILILTGCGDKNSGNFHTQGHADRQNTQPAAPNTPPPAPNTSDLHDPKLKNEITVSNELKRHILPLTKDKTGQGASYLTEFKENLLKAKLNDSFNDDLFMPTFQHTGQAQAVEKFQDITIEYSYLQNYTFNFEGKYNGKTCKVFQLNIKNQASIKYVTIPTIYETVPGTTNDLRVKSPARTVEIQIPGKKVISLPILLCPMGIKDSNIRQWDLLVARK